MPMKSKRCRCLNPAIAHLADLRRQAKVIDARVVRVQRAISVLEALEASGVELSEGAVRDMAVRVARPASTECAGGGP